MTQKSLWPLILSVGLVLPSWYPVNFTFLDKFNEFTGGSIFSLTVCLPVFNM